MTLINARDMGEYPVSWVGPGRVAGEVCLGTEDGKVVLLDGDPDHTWAIKPPANALREAVNGVAFSGGITAVSSRAELVFYQIDRGEAKGKRAAFRFGAHGVVADHTGLFTAPGGMAGLFMARLIPPGDHYEVRVVRPSDDQVYFYKVISLKASTGMDVMVCAARKMGILSVLYSAKEDTIFGFEHEGIDVIDVCSMHDASAPNGVCGIDRRGTFVYWPDVVINRQPTVLRLNEMEGVAYRVLRYQTHLVVLTSKAFYVFVDLAQRFINGEQDWRRVRVRKRPMLAIDMNLLGNSCAIIGVEKQISFFDFASVREETEEEVVGQTPAFPPIKVRRRSRAEHSQREVAASAG